MIERTANLEAISRKSQVNLILCASEKFGCVKVLVVRVSGDEFIVRSEFGMRRVNLLLDISTIVTFFFPDDNDEEYRKWYDSVASKFPQVRFGVSALHYKSRSDDVADLVLSDSDEDEDDDVQNLECDCDCCRQERADCADRAKRSESHCIICDDLWVVLSANGQDYVPCLCRRIS